MITRYHCCQYVCLSLFDYARLYPTSILIVTRVTIKHDVLDVSVSSYHDLLLKQLSSLVCTHFIGPSLLMIYMRAFWFFLYTSSSFMSPTDGYALSWRIIIVHKDNHYPWQAFDLLLCNFHINVAEYFVICMVFIFLEKFHFHERERVLSLVNLLLIDWFYIV